MTALDLPEAKGTYVLLALLPRMKRLEIGRLGTYDIIPGFYAYVGSAFGPLRRIELIKVRITVPRPRIPIVIDTTSAKIGTV